MPLTRRFRSLFVAVITVVLATATFTNAQQPVARRHEQAKPRLVVVIVVDQFRYDYLTRFSDLFVENGIKRFMRDGAFWTNANYNYIPTKTAPGHAAIMTGAPPSGTGLVANEWLERKTSTKVTSVADNKAKALGAVKSERPYSPRLLLASTVGDELRKATGNRAKVFGVSDKPRAAIVPAGRRANGAFWLSANSGTISSSDYYFSKLPRWVVEFNKTKPLDKYFGERWDRLLAEREYLKHAGADAPPWEKIDDAPGQTNTFPHLITGGASAPNTDFYDALDHSPFVNDVILAVAEQVIANEQLGQDEVTDLLTVSLSGNDHVGHRFGPFSQEVMDVTVRVDRQIASLLEFVDTRVGLQNTLCVFSSDHGVAPVLEWIKANKLGRGKISHGEVVAAIRKAVHSRYASSTRNVDDYIMRYSESGEIKDAMFSGNIYFNLDALKRDGVDLNEITELAGKAALSVPGMARYFTRAQLERCQQALKANRRSESCSDPIAQKAVRGFYSERSGDLVIVQKPYNYVGEAEDPANHGTPYSYDTHVPVILMGRDFRRGRYSTPASPLDIAPTLAAVLGIPTPDKSDGRILKEGLIESPRGRR